MSEDIFCPLCGHPAPSYNADSFPWHYACYLLKVKIETLSRFIENVNPTEGARALLVQKMADVVIEVRDKDGD